MNMGNAILYIVGFAIGVLVICLIAMERDKEKENQEYDERQLLAQGKGYRLSFWVGIVCYAYVIIGSSPGPNGENYGADTNLLLFFCVMIQLGVLLVYRLLTHSALPLSRKPLPAFLGAAGLSGTHFFRFWMEGREYEGMPMNGPGTIKWFELLTAVMFLLLAVGYLIPLLSKEREDG